MVTTENAVFELRHNLRIFYFTKKSCSVVEINHFYMHNNYKLIKAEVSLKTRHIVSIL